MSKRGRLFIVLLVLVVCGVFLYPTIQWYVGVPQETKDLVTGSREQIREYARGQATRDLALLTGLVEEDSGAQIPETMSYLTSLARDQYRNSGRDVPRSWTVTEVMRAYPDEQAFFQAIEQYYRSSLLNLKSNSEQVLQLGLDLSGGLSILLEADTESFEENYIQRHQRSPGSAEIDEAVQQSIEILNNRIDLFGISEPMIRRQGDTQIAVEIAGAADPERVNTFLMGRGSLNFRIVNREQSEELAQYFAQNPGEMYTPDGRVRTPDFVDSGFKVFGYYTRDAYGIDELQRFVVVRDEIGLDGIYIEEATVGEDPLTGRPVVNFRLTVEGGERFYSLTSNNVNETMAVVMDDRVRSMATISEPIRENVQIRGFDQDEARDLAIVLRTAALPIELEVINQQAVGASLGEDSVRQGLRAIAVGFALVLIFMAIYYRRAGVIADFALVLNLLILISVLSAFNLTLTLTSIAGLILTVGIAVDANVIIFERIKEEYRLGKSPEAAVSAGFRKAFWTIMDANITTFIAALVLSQLGTGPIQGFANTLAVGIVTSMFCALFVSRLIFDFLVQKLKIKTLRISWRA